jgi:hypothetical protein
MTNALISPANASFLDIPGPVFFVLIPILAVAAFTFIMAKRLAPLMRAQADPRLTRIPQRIIIIRKTGSDQAGFMIIKGLGLKYGPFLLLK